MLLRAKEGRPLPKLVWWALLLFWLGMYVHSKGTHESVREHHIPAVAYIKHWLAGRQRGGRLVLLAVRTARACEWWIGDYPNSGCSILSSLPLITLPKLCLCENRTTHDSPDPRVWFL